MYREAFHKLWNNSIVKVVTKRQGGLKPSVLFDGSGKAG